MFETIVALATPPIKSALALIRVSGGDSFKIVSKCFSKHIEDITHRTAFVGEIKDDEHIVDQVVLIAYKGPKSFTGEDLVEIICHGSMLVVDEIISTLIKFGARTAERGEYSMRAYLNQKIDLVQAESINDVINATTTEAKDLSMMSLKGSTSELLYPIRTKIADLMSLIEVNIDYPEYEDIEVANKEKIIKDCSDIVKEIDVLISDGKKGKIIKDGINVAIVGKPNVGKSSLLNTLIGEDKAIVTSIAGTTRDVVEGDVNINGLTLHLLDTAGIRKSEDVIENIGIEKSKSAIDKADLTVVVLDGSSEISKEDEEILEYSKNKLRIVVYNKADQLSKLDEDKIYTSSINNDVSALVNEIYKIFGLDNHSFKTPSLNNARQIGLLSNARESLINAINDANDDLSVDLISSSLMDAYSSILSILGEDNDIDISKEIFSRFCVGK